MIRIARSPAGENGRASRHIVIGHDWGAAATYLGALLAPQCIRRIVTVAVPYGPAFFRALRETSAQQRRSWYKMFFQHWLAMEALARDDLAMIAHLFREWSPGTAPRETLEAVRETFRMSGTLEAARGYYREVVGPVVDDPARLEATLRGELVDGMHAYLRAASARRSFPARSLPAPGSPDAVQPGHPRLPGELNGVRLRATLKVIHLGPYFWWKLTLDKISAGERCVPKNRPLIFVMRRFRSWT